MKKERQSNFELLRIFSIVFIILFHYVYESGYVVSNLTFNNYVIKSLWLVGEIGVNLFILISGYFLIKSKFSFKKVILLLAELIFYNFISYIIIRKIGIKEGIDSLFYSPYWFIRMYLILYFLTPFINKLIENISKREYQILLIICIIIWSIYPTIIGVWKGSTESVDFYSRMIWFFIMYLIGGYIRLYDIKFLNKNKNTLVFLLIMTIILFSSIGIIYNMKKILFPRAQSFEIAYLWGPNNIITLLLSISIFEFFAHLNIGSNKLINKIASTTLGIYMIHDGLLQNLIWDNILHTKDVLSSKYALLGIIAGVIIIFISGMIIDLLRQLLEKYTVKRILNSVKVNNYISKIKRKCENLINKFV